jgi:DNA-binding transcriptional regulator YiaG
MKEWTPQAIEIFRKTNKLTRKSLGQFLGVSVIAIYQWERGMRKPSKTAKILLSKIEKELMEKKGG